MNIIPEDFFADTFAPNRLQRSDIARSVMSFDEYFGKLYDHQKAAFDKIGSNDLGQIICPTGSGKSKIQIATFFKHLEENPDKYHNYLIASHRLLLNTQLITNLIEDVKKSVRPFRILYVGSGNVDADRINKNLKGTKIKIEDFKSTTDRREINEYVRTSNEEGYDVLIVSTYHSIDKVNEIDIEIACFDEAHSTAGRDDETKFKINLKSLTLVKRKYFFTATRKTYGETAGMNDVFYGEVIYKVSPKEMIDANYICAPRLHLVYNKNDSDIDRDSLRNSKMEVKTILESYSAHNSIIKANAARAGRIPPMAAKMLVNSPGTGPMLNYIKSKELKDYSRNNKCIMMFIASNEKVGCTIIENGEITSVTRPQWMDRLVGLTDEESAIIFHYDILTEGIDLPNITGTLFTRVRDVIKLMQSVGRSLRLLKEDRDNVIVNKTVLPSEKDKQIKPYGYVILPEGFLIDEDDSSRMTDLIRTIINEYEIPEENLILTNTDAQGTREITFDEIGTGLEDTKDKRLMGMVQELYHEIESENYVSKYNIQEATWMIELNIK